MTESAPLQKSTMSPLTRADSASATERGASTGVPSESSTGSCTMTDMRLRSCE